MSVDRNDDVILENALRRALRRETPPEQFRNRVRAGVAARRKRRILRYWSAAAAMLAVSLGAGVSVIHYERQRRVAEAEAGREVVTALKITTGKLHATHQMIRRRSNAI